MLSLHHISPTSTYCEIKDGGAMSDEREGERGWNQLVGSIFEWVKKVAVVGSPMPSMWGMCLSRKWGGISLGIGCPSSCSTSVVNSSGLKSRTVAIRLIISFQVRKIITREGVCTLILFHPTSMEWESRWFLSLLPIVVSIHPLIGSDEVICCMYWHQHNGIYPFVVHWFSILTSTENEKRQTWYSNARWREGRKRSNSKYWRVSGWIKSASFLAFTNISSP